MLRIVLFLATNLAVIFVASITLSLLGVGSYLQSSGTGLNLGNLLVFCLVFGMAGSVVSLLLPDDFQSEVSLESDGVGGLAF